MDGRVCFLVLHDIGKWISKSIDWHLSYQNSDECVDVLVLFNDPSTFIKYFLCFSVTALIGDVHENR